MISLTLRVKTEDTSGDFTVGPKTQVAFEREWKIGLTKAFADQQKVEHVYWLAWKAMHDGGAVVKPFETWLETVESVEMVGADEAPL
jgi:ribulose bisphosphate carboxylase small subunit